MKYYRSIIIGSLLISGVFNRCKKEQPTAPAAKDYSSVVTNKNWWGSLNNSGENVQYYTVHFNPDHSLIWTQMSGDYPGTWMLAGKKLTLTFTSPAVIVTTDISDDNNKWTNITTNTPNKINNGQLLESSTVFLDNTTWTVTRTHVASGTTLAIKFAFLPNNKVVVSPPGGALGTVGYTRNLNGSIRINTITPYFGIISSSTEMRGNFADTDYHWVATKQ